MELTEEEKRAVDSMVLLNPELLKTQYSTSEGLAAEANRFASKDNKVVASNRFESAAKFALYEGNLSSAKEYLGKAVKLGRGSPFDIAFTNFDKIARCVSEFYRNKSGYSANATTA
jgi:hypothetical protein